MRQNDPCYTDVKAGDSIRLNNVYHVAVRSHFKPRWEKSIEAADQTGVIAEEMAYTSDYLLLVDPKSTALVRLLC